MKNILFVVDEKRMGGVSVLLSDIINNLNLKKYSIDIMVLHNNGDCLNNLSKEVNVLYGTKFFSTIDYTLKEVITSKNIIKILNKLYIIFLMKFKLIEKKIIKERKKCIKKQYDVEIAFKDGFCALFTAYGDSKKKYHWLHTDYSMYDCTSKYHTLFEIIFPQFDKIIGISSSVVKKFKEKYNVSNTDVIYNLIDEEKIKAKSNEFTIQKNIKKINFISVGRFCYTKGYDRLINVFSRLNDENLLNNVMLTLIGNGPNFNIIKDLVKKNKLEKFIRLEGLKQNPFPYLKSSDMFILSSRHEAFGLVILEAMILGIPVLSTDVVSINEIMNKKYGIIVENSEEGLYNGIKEVIKNRKILNEYKNNLKGYKYPVDDIIKKIELLLDQ